MNPIIQISIVSLVIILATIAIVWTDMNESNRIQSELREIKQIVTNIRKRMN